MEKLSNPANPYVYVFCVFEEGLWEYIFAEGP